MKAMKTFAALLALAFSLAGCGAVDGSPVRPAPGSAGQGSSTAASGADSAEPEQLAALRQLAGENGDLAGVLYLGSVPERTTDVHAVLDSLPEQPWQFVADIPADRWVAAPGGGRGKNGFHVLMDMLPSVHKARWVANAALTAADQSMASVMSTVLSKLNAFLDSELEQVICSDNPIDAERFASSKCAIFVVIPEEDPTKNFIASLMIQNLSRELFSVADDNEGRLKNRVVIYADEFGTMPPFDVLPLFSAGRSRGLTLVPIIQSLAQLEKNYGKEGAEIVCDNCQDTIFGGFAPQSKTAEALSSALGSRTVLSGSVSQGKESSQSLQMIERPLMTPDELKSVPKGEFVVMKTGAHPMRTRLRLFLD